VLNEWHNRKSLSFITLFKALNLVMKFLVFIAFYYSFLPQETLLCTLCLRDLNSRPQVHNPFPQHSFRSARLSVPGPDKVAFSRLLSRVARLDQPFPRAPFRVLPSLFTLWTLSLPSRVCRKPPHSFLPARFHVATSTTPFLQPRGAVPGITCHLPLFVRP